MNKWILMSILAVLLVAGAFGIVYSNAREPYDAALDEAVQRAAKEAKLTSVDDFYLYNGSETIYSVIGKQKNGTEMAVWIPENTKQPVTIKKLADGISEQEAIKKLYSEENPNKLLGVRLGMEKELPVWELAYLDENSNLSYYYIHFDTGKWWRKIENL
ncbi:MAG TPA: DUF5590 domain-containing protein [Bacillaceae bacterium]